MVDKKLKRWIDKHSPIIGVPCSKFERLIDYNKAIVATREDEALGMAIGAKLMGKNPLVYMQDAGIGACLTVLTSIMEYYDIKIDLLISIRRRPEYHRIIGDRVHKLMKLLNYSNYKYIEERV